MAPARPATAGDTPDFVVPARPSDLEAATSGWKVKAKAVDAARIDGDLETARERLESDAASLHDSFDLAYGAVKAFGQLPAVAQQAACDFAADAVMRSTKAAKRALAASASDRDLAQHRAVLKAAVYLLTWLLQEAEKQHAAAADAASAVKLPRGRGGGKKAAAKGADADTFNWDAQREAAVLRLLEALELDLNGLWGHRQPDGAFVALFSRAAYTVLEQPAALKSGAAALREALWRLIALPAVKYEQAEATVAEVVRVLLGFEHCATHLAELLQRLLEEHDAVRLVADVLRELSTLPASEMGADAAGPKNVAIFLHAVAARTPLMLVANIELLTPHLASDAHALRCGAVSAHGQLLIQIAQLRGTNPEAAAAVDGLLSVPLRRLRDSSSFVRCRALQTLALLAESRALPTPQLQQAATQGLARLADKNANVRQKALQLFATLLDFNPFGPSLSRPLLEQRRDALREKLGADSAAVAAVAAVAAPAETADAGETAAEEAAEGGEEAAAPADSAAAAEDPETRDERVALEVLELALQYEGVLRAHLPEVQALLGSQQISDVPEAMQAIVTAHSFELEGARPARLLTLVCSKEPSIRNAALQAAQSVWLRVAPGGRGGGAMLAHAIGTARGLFELVGEASLGELTSLEEVVSEWQRGKFLPAALVTVLWEVLQGRRPELAAPSDRRGALALLNMAAISEPQLLRCKMALLIEQLHAAKGDLALARHGCVALQRCAAAGPMEPQAAKSVTKALERLLTSAPKSSESEEWFAAAEEAISTLFVLSDTPEAMLTNVLRKMGAALTSSDGVPISDEAAVVEAASTVDPAALSRLLFCVGHVALKTLVHIEACRKKLDKRRAALCDDPASADRLAAELGTSAAAAEEQLDHLDHLATHLLDGQDSLLGAWAPLVAAVCRNEGGQFGAGLRASAVLSLCKLMCVSAEFCDNNLQLLFTVMKNEAEQSIRGNIAIALGDLFFRHPNTLTPWTAHLYAQLRDGEPRVRKNVLLVLMHLILNDMVKVQGQVAELALCLLDADERIASLAKLFFTEFAKKGTSPVYNLLPDIVSSLSSTPDLTSEGFREILGFLVTFIHKDKQLEGMVEKLCHRFDTSDEPRHHRQVAFCLSALGHTDKTVRKLIELYRTYGNKLGDEEVFGSFQQLVSKARRLAKPELKAALDELEGMIDRSQGNGEAADGAVDGAVDGADSVPAEDGGPAAGSATPARETGKAAGKAAAKKPAARKGRGKAAIDDEDEAVADDENAQSANRPAAKGRSRRTARA